MDSLLFIINTVLPVFILIALGYFFVKINLIDSHFTAVSSKIVFTVALPCMIFNELGAVSLSQAFNLQVIGFIYAGTIAALLMAWAAGKLLKLAPVSLGAFIQGCFRGNFVIIGIALIANMQQKVLLGKAALAIAFIMPLYNVLSVIVLSFYSRGRGLSVRQVITDICKNPLMIALALGILYSWSGVQLPVPIQKTVGYFSSLILPLALLSIGGSLAENSLRSLSATAWAAALMRAAIFPVMFIPLAWLIGFRNDDLLLLFIVFSSPTAIVSYIMADAMGSDSSLAGSIILLSTFISVFVISIGLFMLKSYGFI